mgnify:CR=1 FL=1
MNRTQPRTGNGLSIGQILTGLFIVTQTILLWWVFDITTRLRGLELSHSELKSTLAAVQPFAAQDRGALALIVTSVNNHDVILEQSVGLVRDISTIVQSLAKQQIELRAGLDRLEQHQSDGRGVRAPR